MIAVWTGLPGMRAIMDSMKSAMSKERTHATAMPKDIIVVG